MIMEGVALWLSWLIPILVLLGIFMMSKVRTALRGMELSALALVLGIIATLMISPGSLMVLLLICILAGSLMGLALSRRVKMIQMPQMVALLNGLGGGASALVGFVTLLQYQGSTVVYAADGGSLTFIRVTSVLALLIGLLTLTGSLVAAGKLHGRISTRAVHLKGHNALLQVLFWIMVSLLILTFWQLNPALNVALIVLAVLLPSAYGYLFAIRIGGADMPITISLLNSLSGVAGGIAGMAIGNVLLVSIGGIVGASGLLLTQIMCRSMNRSLKDILLGKTTTSHVEKEIPTNEKAPLPAQESAPSAPDLDTVLSEAQSVIIVPGYGMALAQAQSEVKQLSDELKKGGKRVRFAIHPVAGRMPGHMNVLLAEVNVDYDELFEMDSINPDFGDTDLAIVVGANDVLNPAARDAEGTPIYGMPVLNVDRAHHVIICNYDLKPGYAGVPNPLYEPSSKVTLLLGDAKESVGKLLSILRK